ncbi:hypothetical protein GCM10009577_88370 [Streptomyces javensis]
MPAREDTVQNLTDTVSSESILPPFAHQCITQRFITSALTTPNATSYVSAAEGRLWLHFTNQAKTGVATTESPVGKGRMAP